MTGKRIAVLLGIGVLCVQESAHADAEANEMDIAIPEHTVRVAASERYQADRVHRFALGGGYRDLWEAEIELPVLDLGAEGGGLVPIGRFGGLQTAVLGFKARDGRAYTFRGTDKDPSAVLDPLLHDTLIQTVVQDQMAAQHPGGPIAAAVLAEAAGLLAVHERMVVMPDDPALGEYRAEFAGMVGTFFEFPTPASERDSGFHGATEIIDHEELYERLARSRKAVVNVKAFLRARLFDILIGDFDRHRKQWRWAKLPGDPRWQPIPEDRDMAFVRYEGVVIRTASVYVPILQDYGPDYPSMRGLVLHGWEQDRWLLPELSWEDWEAIARDLQARITDATIDQAVRALPPEYVALDGERLGAALRGRRDQLLEGARAFYEHLADDVDVQTPDTADRITVTRGSEGDMLVEIRASDSAGSAADPVYSRRFLLDETSDLRIYLRDGDDRVRVTGEPSCMELRIIAGGGRKLVDDSQGGGTRVYDESGSVEVEPGPGTVVTRRPYELPASNAGFVDVDDVPPRDWGSELVPIPQFSYEKDVGVFLGAGVIYTRYGFRKHPWSSRHQLTAGYATEANTGRVHYLGGFRRENSGLMGKLELGFSGIDVLNFYGFGNETSDSLSNSLYRARNEQVRVAPELEYRWMDDRIRVSGGPWLEYSRTKKGTRLIDLLDPYGSGKFGQIGAFVRLQVDTRETLDDSGLVLPFHENPGEGYPTSGFFLDVTTEVSPEVWDVDETWGAIEGSISTYLSVGENDRATLALRVGGRDTWGKTPYTRGAYIGGGGFASGGSTVRGLRAERFLGDSSVFGNLDLRIFVARVKAIVPSDFGILGFADVGRVFLDGESSDDWHDGYGGGIWLAPLGRSNAISLTVADSDEDTLVYFRFGFAF